MPETQSTFYAGDPRIDDEITGSTTVFLDGKYVLVGEGGGGSGATELEELTDVDLTSPANDNLLQVKAGVWVNRTPAQVKTDLALVKGDVGLGNVDNTSDANKPVSTATQAALDAKASTAALTTAISTSEAGQVRDGDTAGGVLAGTYPNPSFAADMATQAELDAHISDTSDAHDASAISVSPTGAIAATDVQAALAELDTEKATTGSVTTVANDLAAHLADTSDAHDASAVSVVPFGSIAATTVQAALEEIVSEAASGGATDLEGLSDVDLTSPANDDILQQKAGVFVNRTPAQFKTDLALTKSDVGLGSVDNLSLQAHLDDASDAHDASAISFSATGNIAATDVQAAIAELDTEKQAGDADLTAIAGLSPSNDDVIQRKAGAWTNRTMAQVKTDLALVKGDVGLGNVDNVQQQPLDSDLTTIAGLTATTDNFMQAKSSAWASRTPAQVKADLDLIGRVTNAQTGTSYTLVLADGAKYVTMNNASASTLTVPPNSSVAFPVDTEIPGAQLGAGQVTITPGSGVTLRATPGLKVAAQYGSFMLKKLATDEWLVVGRLSA